MDYIASLSAGMDNQIARINELVLIVRDLAESIRMFYHGRGFLRSKLKAHAKCSYVTGRPILAALGDLARASVMNNTYVNRINAFMHLKTLLNLPTDKSYHAPEFNLKCLPKLNKWYEPDGLACSQCMRVFTTKQVTTIFPNHECVDSHVNLQKTLISVTSPLFQQSLDLKKSQLTTEQQVLLEEIMLDNGKNLVVKGGGGAGKTFTAKIARDMCYMTCKMDCTVVIAVTRSAAKHLNGITFHSLLGLAQKEDVSDLLEESKLLDHIQKLFTQHREKYLNIRNNLRVIIMDECGLASDQVINVLDRFLKNIKDKANNPGLHNLPFGGVKIILIGDELQCLPVEFRSRKDNQNLSPLYRYYQSDAYAKGNFYGMYFRNIFRQKNKHYIDILERCRLGHHFIFDTDMDSFQELTGANIAKNDMLNTNKTLANLAILESKTTSKLATKINRFFSRSTIGERLLSPSKFDEEFNTRVNTCASTDYNLHRPAYVVCNENVEVKALENQFVSNLEGSKFSTFVAIDTVYAYARGSYIAELDRKVPKELNLCCGIRVQFTNNKIPGITKNSFGIVTEIHNDHVLVQPIVSIGNTMRPVKVQKYEEEVYSDDGTIAASRKQIALRIGIAGTLYNVQGCTMLEPMIYNNERQARDAEGALFTAASRCDDPRNFICLHAPQKADFQAHIPSVRNDLILFYSKERLTALNTLYSLGRAKCECKRQDCLYCMSVDNLVNFYKQKHAEAYCTLLCLK